MNPGGALRAVRLVNPNSSSGATARMVAAARAAAPAWMTIEGHTTAAAPPLIVDDGGAEVAAAALLAEAVAADHGEGVILSAFVDPGIDRLRRVVGVPVVGIGEASLREAAAVGRFSVVMTTPGLIGMVRRYATVLGVADRLASTPGTDGDPASLMADPERLLPALEALVAQAVREDGAEAVVIGAGPLADAARALAATSPVPLVEPVPAAVRRMAALLGGRGDPRREEVR